MAKRKELEEQVESERAANRDLARQLEEARQGNSQASGLSPDDPIASKTFEELKKMEEEQRNVKKGLFKIGTVICPKKRAAKILTRKR